MENQSNKLESPDFPMDISENCTTENNSNSQTSISQADIEINEEKLKNSDSLNFFKASKNVDQESINNQNTYNLNPQSSSTSQKLTPVRTWEHPLMFDETADDGDESDLDVECGNSNVRNFPDIVLMTHSSNQQQQPLRLNQSTTKATKSNVTAMNSVNNNDGKNRIVPKYREPSPDLYDFKSDSEPDVSQYQAEVCASFQKVSLVNTNPQQQAITITHSSSSPKFLHLDVERRKLPLNQGLQPNNDDSSPEETSYHAEDFGDDLDDEFGPLPMNSCDNNGKCLLFNNAKKLSISSNSHARLPIPEYSATEENRNVRNFQCITLPDGKTREIDMKVIDPYKRILSHGGYLKAGGHNAIVVFSACHLPDRSRKDYNYVMNNLFYYVIKTLEQLVTDDYVLVYLHGASNRKNSPPFPWLKRCYQLLDRRLRKSLKSCYIVHPTFWLKSLIWMTRPFISSKFWRKLVYVRSLEELYTLVPLERNSIPEKVLNFNARHSS